MMLGDRVKTAGQILLLTVLALAITLAPLAAGAAPDNERRVALVIGIGTYRNAPHLANPVNDAHAIGDSLRRLRFDVTELNDADFSALSRAIRMFGIRAAAADVALVYYAGHGVQVDHENYIIPADAKLERERDLLYEAMPLDRLLGEVSQASKVGIVLLDSCRNNPFTARVAQSATMAGRSLVTTPGLARVDNVPRNTIVVLAAKADQIAEDGGEHSPFAAALLEHFQIPGLELSLFFRSVRDSVLRSTNDRQEPYVFSSLGAEPFYFYPKPIEVAAVTGPAEPAAGAALWESVRASSNPADFAAFLRLFPASSHADEAKHREAELLASAAKTKASLRPETAPGNPADTAALAKPEVVAGAAPAEPSQSRLMTAANAPLAAPPQTGLSKLQDCPTCPVMIRIPAGSFMMGLGAHEPEALPPHHVEVGAFALGRTPVTVAEWKACMAAKGCDFLPRMRVADDRTPVHNLSWDDAFQYIAWLSQTTGHQYRLPSEAEWEYAARGGTTTRYWWGNEVGVSLANCTDCGGAQDAHGPLPVDALLANPFGLYDMLGGVAQWTADCWFPNYRGAPADATPRDSKLCQKRVLRGGSFRAPHEEITVTYRGNYDAPVRYLLNGFRVARDLE